MWFRTILIIILFNLVLLFPKNTFAADFYVDPDGSNDNGGSIDEPFLTITYAVSVANEGDSIFVQSGTYPEHVNFQKSQLAIIASGTVNMNGIWVGGDDNLISGFTITNPQLDSGLRVEGNRNVFTNNDISNTKQDGIWFFGDSNVFKNNYIHDIPQREEDPHIDCFQTWGPATNILFDSNICHISNKSGSNQIAQIESQSPNVSGLVFINNIFIMEDPGYGPLNVHRKSGQEAISDIKIINNHFINSAVGQYGISLINISGANVQNNLFYNYGDENFSYVYVTEGSDIDIKNNAVYKEDGIAPHEGPFPGDVWMENPLFANYDALDFHLSPQSPLIDRGTEPAVVLDHDLDGLFRPSGEAFDIGAYEHQAIPMEPTPVPIADSNVNRFFTTPSVFCCNDPMPWGNPDLFQIDVNDTQAILYFAPAELPLNKYVVSYGLWSGDERFATEFSQGYSSGVLFYTINCLEPNTTYYFKIRAVNGCMPGDWSNEMKIVTTKIGASPKTFYKSYKSKILRIFPRILSNIKSSLV